MTLSGERLGGRYRLTERLAFGGMGEVWAGVDEVLGRAVAVKILRPELARDDAFRRRFREEARTAGGLSHPGIAAVYDYGEGTPSPPAAPHGPHDDPVAPGSGGTRYGAGSNGAAVHGYQQHEPDWTSGNDVAYLVMELVPGKPLSAILAEDGPLPPVQAFELVAQAARALQAAHQRGVVHRDVKPANLMVTPEGRLKVTDFGIARPQDHEPLTATGQVMGTAHYLAPELARGHLATALSDVYALGVVAYECVAGRRPFEGDNQVAVATAHLSEDPPPLSQGLPPDVRRVITTAMQKDPDHRFTTAESFGEVLDLVRFRLQAGEAPPIWATYGPVPGVGAGAVPLPRTTGGRAGPGARAGTADPTGFPGGVGPTAAATRYSGAMSAPDATGSDTAALPLDRWSRRSAPDGGQRRRTVLIPVVGAVAALALAAGMIALFSQSDDGGNPRIGPTTPAPSPPFSSQPHVAVPTLTSRTTNRQDYPSVNHQPIHPETPTPTRSIIPTPTETITSTPTSTITSTPTSTITSTPTETTPTTPPTTP